MNPILDASELATGFEWISYHYPEADSNGLPKKNICLVFIKGSDFSTFDGLSEVDKLPEGNLSVAINDTPLLKQKAINLLKNTYDVPVSIFADCVIWRDVIKIICKHMHPDFKSFGSHIKNEDFV